MVRVNDNAIFCELLSIVRSSEQAARVSQPETEPQEIAISGKNSVVEL